MKTKILAFSIACAVLFAETSAAWRVSAAQTAASGDAAKAVAYSKAAAAVQAEDDRTAENDSEDPYRKTVTVKAYQITSDHVKILLNQKELRPAIDSYGMLLGNLYPSGSYDKTEEKPEDTARISGWFLTPDGLQRVDTYSKLALSEDHCVYYMTKNVPVHYVRFDAGEGKTIWTVSKPSYYGTLRSVAENEAIYADQDKPHSQIPTAEWGDRAFLGWFTAPEGGEKITGDSVISGDKELTFYAHWDKEGTASPRSEYYVTMINEDTEEGEEPYILRVAYVQKGDAYGKVFKESFYVPSSYTRVKKEDFVSGTALARDWYTEKEGGEIVDERSEKTVPGDTVLYYRKEVFPCHYISFDAGEGELFWNVDKLNYREGNVEPAKSCEMIAMEDHAIGALPTAENGTHAFLGWFTQPEGGTLVDSNTVYKDKSDLKLYAHWDAEGTTEAPKGIKLRIYNVDSQTGALTVQRDYRGEDCETYYELMFGKNHSTVMKSASASSSVSQKIEIPDGMTYQYGLNTEANGGQTVSMIDPLLKNEDHALYNHYGFVPYYHVLFDANGGKVVWNGAKTGMTFSNDRALRDNEIAMIKNGAFSRLPNAVNGSRKFLGWFTEPDGGEQIKDYSDFKGSGDTTYYAHWDEEGTETPVEGVYMNCYRFNTDTSAYALYGNYLVKPGTTYAGASLIAPSVSVPRIKGTEIPEGKLQKALWYTEPEGGFRADGSSEPVPDHDFALYVRSGLVGFHYVTFDPGEGDLSLYDESETDRYRPVATTKAYYASSSSGTTVRDPGSNQIMVYEGGCYGALKKAYQTGKAFLGWFTELIGGTEVKEDTIFNGTDDQTLYAHYGEKTEPSETTTTTTASATTLKSATTTSTTSTTTTSTTKPTTTTTTTTSTTKPTTITTTTTSTTKTTTTTTTTSTTKPTTTTTTTTSTTKPTTTTTTTTSTTKPTTTTSTTKPTTTTTTTSTTKPTTTTTTTTSTTKPTTTTTTTTSTTKPTTTTTTTTTTAATTTTAQDTTASASVSTTGTSATETTAATGETTEPKPEYLLGDLNDDGTVSVEDAQLALLAYVDTMAGLDSGLTEKQKLAGDINGDKDISVEDAQTILLYYVRNTLSGESVTWDELLGKKAAAPLPFRTKRKDLLG